MFELYGSLLLYEYFSNLWRKNKIHKFWCHEKQETLTTLQLRKQKHLSVICKRMNEEAGSVLNIYLVAWRVAETPGF